MSGTSFKQLLAAMSQNNDSFSVTLPDDWLQGRTAYGGLSAALCYEAACRANWLGYILLALETYDDLGWKSWSI